MIKSPSDARLKAYVSLARNGKDYTFFQNLTEKMDKASGDEKKKLEDLRTKLLDLTNEIDKQLEARYKQAQEMVEKLLAQDDVAKATKDNIQSFTLFEQLHGMVKPCFAALYHSIEEIEVVDAAGLQLR